jgi:hypothetical protein
MRWLEIVGINYLPVIAELGELLLADLDLLVILFNANRFVSSHIAFVTQRKLPGRKLKTSGIRKNYKPRFL